MKRQLFGTFTFLAAFGFAGPAALAEPGMDHQHGDHEHGDKAEKDGKKQATVGHAAPDFTLTDTRGNEHSLSDFDDKIVVLEWTNHGCPFVQKWYRQGHMQELQQQYTDTGDVVWLTISSSSEGQQGYMPNEAWNRSIEEMNINSTAVLIDDDGKVGQMYRATNTPHMYVIDKSGTLAYQGAIDDNPSHRTQDIADATVYVVEALEAVRAGEEVQMPSTKAYGCAIKYTD